MKIEDVRKITGADKREQQSLQNNWKFLVKPSRLPRNIKRLRELDECLLGLDNVSHYTESSSNLINSNNLSYNSLLSKVFTIVGGYE